MKQGHEQQVLDAVVKLTSQRDLETLARSLLESIDELAQTATIRIYSLGGELGQLSGKLLASNHQGELTGSHLTSLESYPQLKACLDQRQVVIKDADPSGKRGYSITYPVLEQEATVGLVACEYPKGQQPPDALIQTLVAVYANQQSLLNHQQRDGLTGLYNRVALQNWMGKSLHGKEHGERRHQDETCLGCFAMLDIDYFKRINDTRGHLYGDEVLLTIADLMRESFRFNDLLFRYGGEEFAAILNDTELDATLSVLERFRHTVAQYPFARLNQVTITIGVARIAPSLRPEVLIERADKALYYGKEHGRNQVNAFEWLELGQLTPALGDRPYTIKLF